MGVWSSLSDLAAEGGDAVEGLLGMGDSPAEISQAANGVVNAIPSVSDMESGTGAAVSNTPVGRNAGQEEDEDSWVAGAIKAAMGPIMGAAMRPSMNHANPVGAGHGISASGGTAMQPASEIMKMASDNPLEGLHQWAGLFG